MKEIFTLDTTLADPIVTPGISFQADTIIMQNPTRYSLAVRAGSKSRPRGVGDATFVCPPGSMLVLPVNASEFSILATTPNLTIAPEGMPTIATITFTRDEKPPAFGVIPLTGTTPPDEIILITRAPHAAGFVNDTVALPPGIRAVELRNVGASLTEFRATGALSQTVYARLIGADAFSTILDQRILRFPVYDSLDTSLTISTDSSATANGYTLVGYYDPQVPGLYRANMRQMVDVVPPGSTIQPVDVDTFGLGVPASTSGSAVAPGALAVVATTPALAAGTYRLRFSIHSTNAAAAGQVFIVARYTAGGVFSQGYIFAPTPTMFGQDIYVTVLVNETIKAVPQIAAGAGTIWSAYFAWVKIG